MEISFKAIIGRTFVLILRADVGLLMRRMLTFSLSSLFSRYNVLGWFAAPIVSGAVMDTISKWQAQHLLAPQGKEVPLS